MAAPPHRAEESSNVVACLEAFLENSKVSSSSSSSYAYGASSIPPSSRKHTAAASPVTGASPPANASGISPDVQHGTSEDRGGERDIRAVTSGVIPVGGGSSSEGRFPHSSIGVGRDTGTQTEVLRVLEFLFHSDRGLVDSCIQVMDKSRVVRVRARDCGRTVWLVQGSRGAPYLCLGNYCSCRSFHELIRRAGEHPVLCKHLLAVRLAPALGVAVEEEVDDDKLVQRISACDYG